MAGMSIHMRLLLVSILAVSALSAKKEQPVLDWKNGILWETPDACNEKSASWKATFLILADDTLYHVAYTAVLHKPNVTEGNPVRWDIEQGDFFLEDEDGRVFKMAIVKKEVDPAAQARFKSGKLACQP